MTQRTVAQAELVLPRRAAARFHLGSAPNDRGPFARAQSYKHFRLIDSEARS
jgi:hypothetical protein